MSGIVDRQFISQLVIVVAIGVGGWMMMAQPHLEQVNALRAEIDERRAAGAAASHSQEALVARVAGSRQRLADVKARNAISQDSSRLYGTIMDLATAAGVRVQRMQPGVDRARGRSDSVSVSEIELSVEGGYAELAAFLDRMAQIDGFLRPSMMQIAPLERDGQRLVSARLTFEALRFAVPAELAQLEVRHEP